MPAQSTPRPLVVVVDDTPAVRQLISRVLELDGHVVAEAPDGVAATRLLEGLSDPPALVITDLKMPTMSGEVLGQWMKAHYPHVPVLFISGFPAEHSVELPGPFLPKPFTNDGLIEAVRVALRNGNPSAAAREA